MSKSLAFFFLFAAGTISGVRAQKSATASAGEDVAVNRVQKAKRTKGKADWLTALYLRPVEQTKSMREYSPLVPAQLLEGHATLCVDTPDGPKTVSQLKKGDVLYRYEPTTRLVSAWEVRIVQRKARRADALYSVENESNSLLSDKRIALGR
ncbi:hypothetical protein [Persicitalea jodogahamensis]|nr:hypothetical protein [Persicitalea jodogahamensis]